MSVHLYQCGCHWMDFQEILYWGPLLKPVKKIQILLKSFKNIGYFTWGREYVSYCWQWQMWHNSTENTLLCFCDNPFNIHYIVDSNLYVINTKVMHCHICMATAFMQTCHNVTLYIHFPALLCLTLFLHNLRIDLLKPSNNVTVVTSVSLIFRTTVYIEHMTAWYDLKTHNEVITLKFFSKITKSVGTAGLTGLDRLFSFMIVTELQVCFMSACMFHSTCWQKCRCVLWTLTHFIVPVGRWTEVPWRHCSIVHCSDGYIKEQH
jgi:hypothetical protein